MKRKFNFMDPKVIMTVVVTLIILAVGTFAFFVTWGALEDTDIMVVSGTECQAVTNPSVSQLVVIGEGATNLIVKEHLTDGTWRIIDSGNYSYVGGTVTITVTG